MKTLIVLECDLPDPEDVVDVLRAIDPPNVPHFAGNARIVVEPHASVITDWLDK